jgi:signal transduction histidine kinase/CheY-like chemotaxis protein
VIAGLILVAGLVINLVQLHARKTFVQNLQEVFHRLPAALAEFDAQDRLVLWNQTYADLVTPYGARLIPGIRRSEILQAVAKGGAFDLLEGGETDRAADFSARQKQGEALDWPLPDGRWVQVETRPIGDSTLTVITDISDHRAGAMLLAEARDRAEAASRSKSEFLTNMSHEIRTPLNGVLGMVQVMEADTLSEAQRDRLKTIKQSGGALLAILNDVLDLSKIEAGKLEIAPVDFDLDGLAMTACTALEGAAAGKDLTLSWSVDPVIAGAWRGDALRIRQILANLMGNAVKFTEQGEVRLEVRREPDGVAFAVHDTGIGIDADQIPRLFERFSQEDATTTRRFGGTGLGLAICRELAELMGGRIEAQSVKGEGSTFRLVLPLQRLSASQPSRVPDAEPRPAGDEPLRVLAAEDNEVNQLVLRSLLEPIGVELTLVDNGREAVEAFAAGDFDVILMDIMMPELNGVDASKAVRDIEAERGWPRTPIIALTANVMQHQLDDYRAAGMDGALAKPIELEKLYAMLEHVLGDGEPDLEAAA